MGTAAAHATPSVSSASGRRCSGDRGSAPHRKCASLSLATAHHGRAVSGGRGHHDARASAGRASQGDARPAGRRGERGWRRGSIGVARSARAAPDGYSLSFGNRASHVGAGAVYPVAYDVLADFEPVSRVADTPLWVVARKAGKGSEGADHVAQGAPGQGVGRDGRPRERIASVRDLSSEQHWDPLPIRALSRRCAGDS